MNLFLDYSARVRIVYVEVPEEMLRTQNRARVAAVPDGGLERLLERWEVPEVGEAHELSHVVDGGLP